MPLSRRRGCPRLRSRLPLLRWLLHRSLRRRPCRRRCPGLKNWRPRRSRARGATRRTTTKDWDRVCSVSSWGTPRRRGGGLVRGLRPRARRPTACIWAGYASGRRETDLLRFEAKTEAGTGEAPCVRFASSMFVPRFKFCRAAKKRYKRPHCCLSDATTARESSLIPYTSPKLQNRSSRRRRGSKTASFGQRASHSNASRARHSHVSHGRRKEEPRLPLPATARMVVRGQNADRMRRRLNQTPPRPNRPPRHRRDSRQHGSPVDSRAGLRLPHDV